MKQIEYVEKVFNGHGYWRRGRNFHCPGHDDRRPSLSIDESADGSGWVLVKCHAGCRTKDVLAEVGLTLADLFPEGHPLKPAAPYSSVTLEMVKRMPSSPSRTLWIASMLGRYVHVSGSRARVYSGRAIGCIVVEDKHRKRIMEEAGITHGTFRNTVMEWKQWGSVHRCSQSTLTILVRPSTHCPMCGELLVNEASGIGDTWAPQALDIGDTSRHKTVITQPRFSKGIGLGNERYQPSVTALKKNGWATVFPEGDGSPEESR